MVRLMVRTVIVLLVLSIVLVGADVLAALLVRRSVAQGLQVSQGLDVRPSVTFGQRPFLTQALRGRYARVDVTMTGVPTAGPLVVDHLDTTLYGVRADPVPALRGELEILTADDGTADAYVSFAALQAAATRSLPGQGADVTLWYGAADRVAFTARLATVVGTLTVRGQTQVRIDRGKVTVRLLPETLTGVPALLRGQVAAQVRLDGLVPELPFGFRATRVVIEPTGLKLRATGSGLRIPV